MLPEGLRAILAAAQVEEEEPTGYIRFERFERMMSRILMENQAPPSAHAAPPPARACMPSQCVRAREMPLGGDAPRVAARGVWQYPRDSEEKLLRAFRVRT